MKTIILIVFNCAVIFGTTFGFYSGSLVEEVYKWKKVTYENLPRSENSYVGPHRYYDPENCDISSMAYHPASGLMIVNVARLRPGVPATIAAFCVQDYSTGSSPKIWGFPNYEVNALRASDFTDGRVYDDDESRTHKRKPYKPHHGNNYYYGHHGGHNSYYGSHHFTHQKPYYPHLATTTMTPKPYDPYNKMRIISTYISSVDERCNRAFIVDTGVLNYYGNDTRVIQKPALLVFSLSSDCCETRNFPLARRSEIPDEVASILPFGILFLKLDYQSSDCDDVFVYIANAFGNYIIVYDYRNDQYWSFTNHPTFQRVAAEANLVFQDGDKTFYYDAPLGMINFALGYQDKHGDRTAYYISGTSTAQFAVSTRVLKDKSLSPTYYNPDDFSIMGYRGCGTQAGNIVIDYTYAVMFYIDFQSNKIRCWNMNKPLNPDNVGVIYDSEEKLPYGTQIFVDSRGYLWFNSCHLPILFFKDYPLNLQRPHARIFRVKVSHAIRGTVCEDEDSYRFVDLYDGYGN